MKENIFNLRSRLIIIIALCLILTSHLAGLIVFEDYIKYNYKTDSYYANRVYDFSQIKDIKKRKKMFIDFMSLIIKTENKDVLANRNRIKELRKKNNLTRDELKFINNIEKVYLLDVSENSVGIDWTELLKRVDIIPLELAITQAAIESGWGTSVFAQKANNMYGHWTYKAGTGLVPKKRDKGKKHEIAVFTSVNDSVRKYMLNLNTNRAYKLFRDLRDNMRKSGSELKGEELSAGLVNYSGIGEDYIKMINSIIKDVSNKLEN